MGKSTISMTIFNSYVQLPEGNTHIIDGLPIKHGLSIDGLPIKNGPFIDGLPIKSH